MRCGESIIYSKGLNYLQHFVTFHTTTSLDFQIYFFDTDFFALSVTLNDMSSKYFNCCNNHGRQNNKNESNYYKWILQFSEML